MEPDARYTIVGAFVVGGVVAIVLFILWITETASNESSTDYAIYFKEQNLDGLQINSNVTMKGIKVGSVDSVAIAPTNIEQVRVVVRILDGTPIKADTQATIQRNLLTGLASIDLVGSTQGSGPLEATLPDEPFVVIPAGRSKIEVVAKSLPDVFSNVSSIAERVNAFLSPENQQAFAASLKNIEQVSGVFASESSEIKLLIRDMRRALQSFDRLAGTSATEMANLSADVRFAMEQLKAILVKVDVTAAELSGAVSASSRVLVQEFDGLTQSLRMASCTSRCLHLSSRRLCRSIPTSLKLNNACASV